MILSYKTTFDTGEETFFKKQIIEKIKNHSLRENKSKQWRVGMPIEQATGIREEFYNFFQRDVCKGLQEVKIFNNETGKWIAIEVKHTKEHYTLILVPGTKKFLQFIKRDGFKNEKQFFNFFDKDKELTLIHWTDQLYK